MAARRTSDGGQPGPNIANGRVTGAATRQSPAPGQSQGTSRTRRDVDAEALMQAAVSAKVMQSETMAKLHLEKQGYLVPEQVITLSNLSNTLCLLSHASSGVPAVVRDGILAVAKLLQGFEQREFSAAMLKHACNTMATAMKPTLDELKDSAIRAEIITDKICEVLTVGIKKTLDGVGDDLATRADNLLYDLRTETEELLNQAKEAAKYGCASTGGYNGIFGPTEDDDEQNWANDPADFMNAHTEDPPPGSRSYAAATAQGAGYNATPSSCQAADTVEAKKRIVFIDYKDPAHGGGGSTTVE